MHADRSRVYNGDMNITYSNKENTMRFTLTPNEDSSKVNLHRDGDLVAILPNDRDSIQDAISRMENVLKEES